MAFQSMDMTSLLRTASSSKMENKQMVLRPGQIISGKILEIFPNQRASVQLGNQQFVAQLQTALNLNGEYWFQVQTGDKLVHLKVLTDLPTSQPSQNQAANLLKQLQLPVTKDNLQFVKQLITSDTPFRPEELKQALQIQQGNGSKGSQPLLMDMMRRQLPITSTIYQAMSQEGKEPLRVQLDNLLATLTKSEANTPLLNRINSLLPMSKSTSIQNDFSAFLSKQVANGDQAVIELLKQAGISNGKEMGSQLANQQQGNVSTPTVISESQSAIITKLTTLFQTQLPLTNQRTYQFQKLMQVATNTNDSKMSSQQLQNVQTFLEQPGIAAKLADIFVGEAKAKFINWQQQPSLANLEPVVADLKRVAEQQVPKNIENKLTDLLASFPKESTSLLSPKDQFLLHAKQFMTFSGLDYEHQIIQENNKNIQQENSLKQLVLQALQTGQAGKSDLESLLQTLNGMQLASVREEAGFIQASIQLPGLYGIEKDIQIEFESKKDDDGQINAEYCRVVFYLSLEKMGDTMIDMSIQKRVVQLTIHNQHESIAPLLENVKPVLQSGLEKNGYQLSSVKYKQITSEIENSNSTPQKKESYSPIHQGVDFRV